MTIQPITRSVIVAVGQPLAFDLFTARMADWWPKGRTIGKNPHAEIIAEPFVGGRWFERDAAGVETMWGRVMEWQPPSRVIFAWQINSQWVYDPDFETELELRFETHGDRTLVTLEHRNLERFGSDAAKHAALLDGGWPGYLGAFARFADQHSKS